MEYIVRFLNTNEDILTCTTVTEIINYFKENKKYKFPNFLREELKQGHNVRFSIGTEQYYIRLNGEI
jgi:hypothetical protein